jgi:ribosomal protein S18 acetylase RimI-like enzyme
MTASSSLTNPAWPSLCWADEEVVRRSRNGAALAYDPLVSIWGGREDPTDPDWAAMDELAVDAMLPGVVLDSPPPTPQGHSELFHGVGYQMVRRSAPAEVVGGPDTLIELSGADGSDMVELTAATEPGPFSQRTVELGGYIGVRDRRELVAMAGRRLATADWVEISAVCTAESARRRGLARRLSDTVARSIEAEGRMPILHVLTTNTAAIAIYESLGFAIEREMHFLVFSVDT